MIGNPATQLLRRGFTAILLPAAAGALLLLAEPASAQGNQHVFHVYVDPQFGDDWMAFHLNPGAPGSSVRRQFLANYPLGFPDPAQFAQQGHVQHAPYSFRSVTGNRTPSDAQNFGAMAYINTVFPPDQVGPDGWVNQQNGQIVRWIVIHCLPGLYGPNHSTGLPPGPPGIFVPGAPAPSQDIDFVDDESGGRGSDRRFNGERFPIYMRTWVSIQGTSALDTIFDARRRHTHVFDCLSGTQGTLSNSFIDSITIRGARSDGQPPRPSAGFRNKTGAGIYIGPEGDNRVTVSNCIITDNTVGIAIEADTGTAQTFVARPTIINNTLAWNGVGIWSGNTVAGQPGYGVAQPRILNNIIDPGRPETTTGAAGGTVSGLHPWDLGALIGPGPDLASFNAYPAGTENGSGTLPANYPAGNPAIRDPQIGVQWPGAPLSAYPAPRVDLGPYMPEPGVKPRGILYVSDAFRVRGDPWNRSGHDLRLAPHTVADATTLSPASPITELNPLVNMGTTDIFLVLANHATWWASQGHDQPEHNGLDGIPGLPGPRLNSWDRRRVHSAHPFVRILRTEWRRHQFGGVLLLRCSHFDRRRAIAPPAELPHRDWPAIQLVGTFDACSRNAQRFGCNQPNPSAGSIDV